jgi:hypothetical protein
VFMRVWGLLLIFMALAGCSSRPAIQPGTVEVRSTEELGKIAVSTAPLPVQPKN